MVDYTSSPTITIKSFEKYYARLGLLDIQHLEEIPLYSIRTPLSRFEQDRHVKPLNKHLARKL